jgi:hypothetical protein
MRRISLGWIVLATMVAGLAVSSNTGGPRRTPVQQRNVDLSALVWAGRSALMRARRRDRAPAAAQDRSRYGTPYKEGAV